MKACAPAGCVVCRYPASTVHERFGVVHASCVATADQCWVWLSVLMAGPVGGCVVCRGSTIWHHPEHGGVHPACVARGMDLFEEDGVVRAPAPSPEAPIRRGAYARRAARVG